MNGPTVCACYIHAHEPESLARSIAVMSSYAWIKDIVVVHTDRDELSSCEGKVDSVFKKYGRGFDKQPEQGGFNEVDARNHALRLGRDTGCDWLLIVDSDEFFLPDTIDQIAIADRSMKNTVLFECWHFFSPTQYIFFPESVRSPTTGSPPMHDCHPRAIRASSPIVWEMNPNEPFRNGNANRTMHCVLTHEGWHKAMCVPGFFHIHTHHMFGAKRERLLSGKRVSDINLRNCPASHSFFPQIYLDAYVPLTEG